MKDVSGIEPEIVIHDLNEQIPLTPPSKLINNMEVNYEEVSHEKIDDFIITAAVKDIDVNYEEVNAKKDQFELTFDLHLDKGQKKTGEININEIEVIGHIEVKPI